MDEYALEMSIPYNNDERTPWRLVTDAGHVWTCTHPNVAIAEINHRSAQNVFVTEYRVVRRTISDWEEVIF